MSFDFPVPALRAEHVKDAILYANRNDALQCWPKFATVAEVGVAYGEFSKRILEDTNTLQFHAYDQFTLHQIEVLWGKPTVETFKGRTHRQFYEDRFPKEMSQDRVLIFEGDSSTELGKAAPRTYDVIYLDGDHSYAGVKRDTDAALKAIKPGGMLVFNDYVVFDKQAFKYGVVPVVNSLCCDHGWRVKYFALHPLMFCDIGIVKA